MEVEVWLEMGREGMKLTYADFYALEPQPGDIVCVKVRGRLHQGLVVTTRPSVVGMPSRHILQPVEEIVEAISVASGWHRWLEAMAMYYHTTSFRMLKAALPPGWLSQRQKTLPKERRLWWLSAKIPVDKAEILLLPPRQIALLEHLILQPGGSAWQCDVQQLGFSSNLLKSLLNRGLISREQRPYPRQSSARSLSLESPRCLSADQRKAIRSFDQLKPGEIMLLWGVTGSGKTEVYLQLAQQELNKGYHVLLLTPEIGLVPQLVDRCRHRFGDKVLEYHSACSDRERVNTWRKSSKAISPQLVVGTRSAVFLPLDPLGLIILDEEHDSSYKQESPMPCYHARHLAIDRAQRCNARVLLGSATPSLETWVQLRPHGNIYLERLSQRISRRPLPPVYVVDMRQELTTSHRRLLSRPLIDRLAALANTGDQAVILVPRRGYNSFLSCRSCGEAVQCPNCDVTLKVHHSKENHQWLHCHWCNHREGISQQCKHCGSSIFKSFGSGTQRVVDHLARELKGLRLLRFDRDTTGGRNGHRRLLEHFAAGKADVLVGTQMLAKGMDLARVTLAVVLAADSLLHRPDLRATEQSMQLLMQLAGRAGRAERPGSVLVQTYCPDHPVIRHFVDGQYESFLEEETCLRRDSGLVPFSKACLLRLAGESSTSTADAAAVLAMHLQPVCSRLGWMLIGPAPAPVPRIAGRSRWQILLHGPANSQPPLTPELNLWNNLPRGVSLTIDPDPLRL